jgi:signal transduction histidine kinase
MFKKELSYMNDDIDKEIKEKLNKEANTTVMKITLASANIGWISLALVQLFNEDYEEWINLVLFPACFIIIASIIILSLRKLKLRENIITHIIIILHLMGISAIQLAYSAYGGVTVWAVILLLVAVSMCYFSNGIVLIYSFLGGLAWLVYFSIARPSFSANIDITDHFGRIYIFLILSATSLWVNKRLKNEVLGNYKKLQLIENYSKELEVKNANLQKLDKLKDEFLANTTHELNTPLHGIIGILEPLIEGKHGSLTSQQQKDVTLAISSAKRLSGLVGDILDFSKLKNRDIILKKQSIDIFVLTDMVCKTFEHQVSKKSINLINKIDTSTPLIYADENRFLQIMYNLLGNAIKFTESGEVIITADIIENSIHITVSDTGIGISKDKQQVIFNAFEQADNSVSRNYGGTGLGLAITKSLVELHGGKIEVNSEPSKGTSFIFTLPLSETKFMDKSANSKLPKQEIISEYYPEADILTEGNKNAPLNNNFRILVVDDEPINIQIIYNILSTEEYNLTSTQSGKQALDLILGNEKFDLILLDVMMPQISGFEVCRIIRDKYTLTQLPILLVTAKNTPEDLVQGFESGANDYLHKPFNSKELLSRVRTLLELKKASELALSAELYFLQSQIKPHFLHNTLAAIMSFIRINPDFARELIFELSNYLRESFNFTDMNSLLPLSKELSMVKSYLFIEKARFSNKLNYTYDIDDSIECDIPHLILQPIVENAVRHGILENRSGGTVKITVKNCTDYVLLCVEDDGIGIKKENIPLLLNHELENTGIGLYNVQKRMLTLYGHGIDLDSEPGKGTKICLKIPHKRGVNL